MSSLTPITLITGAASGLGAAAAQALARRSTGGLILVDRDEDALSASADALTNVPERVSTLAIDVGDEARWTQAADFIKAHYGRVDWLVIDASATTPPDAGELIQDLRAAPRSTLDAAFLTLRAIMPLMRMNVEGGAVILFGSGLDAEAGAGPEKADLPKLTRLAARQGAPDQIRVNSIAPGGGDTEAWRAIPSFQDLVRECGSDRAALDRVAVLAMPLVRYQNAHDVIPLAVGLLTENSPISGAAFAIEGGYPL